MPRKSLTFLERYGDRFLLGVAIVVLVLTFAHYGVRSPHRIRYEGRLLPPDELHAAILQRAEGLRTHIDSLPVTKTPVPKYHRMLEDAFYTDPLSPFGEPRAFVCASLPRATDFGIAIPPVDPVDPERNLILLPALPPVELATTTGRSIIVSLAPPTNSAPDLPNNDTPEPPALAVSWVSVGGWFDPTAQREAFRAAGYSNYRAQVVVVGVDLQRQRRLADGSFSAWQSVESPRADRYAPPEPAFDASGALSNRADLNAAFQLVKLSQAALRQSPFHEVTAGSPWSAPLAAEDPSDPPADRARVAVWAHDASAEPGQTYRYRLRVNLWNRYVGQARLLRDPDDATRTAVEGTWSQPTDLIVAAPDTHIFLVRAQSDRNRASVEVWKWHVGRWLRQVFDVGVGEMIGSVRQVRLVKPDGEKPALEPIDFGTRAVVIDLCFDVPTKLPPCASATAVLMGQKANSAVLTYAVGDAVHQRVAALDRNDPLRRELARP